MPVPQVAWAMHCVKACLCNGTDRMWRGQGAYRKRLHVLRSTPNSTASRTTQCGICRLPPCAGLAAHIL